MILYHTEGCHLCELAESLASRCIGANGFEKADIADDPELFARYGTLIPVLRDPVSGQELRWPFGTDEILRLLDSTGRRD